MRLTKRALIAMVALILLLGGMLVAVNSEYTVKKGDTLWEIAKAYGLDWKEIANLNCITDEFTLQIGTVLKIPTSYTEQSLLIPNGDHNIPAIICLPNGNGPFPIVVMLHGTGSDKNEAGGGYLIAAPALAEAGIASIRFDFIGNGESNADYIDYNFTTALSDTNAALEYAAGLDRIDEYRAGVMGWSQGGTIALLAAGNNPAFKSVLCWAGAPDLSGVGSLEAYEVAKEKGYYELNFDWRTPLKLGLQWFTEAYGTDVLQVFSNSSAPVLAINGTEDTTVDPINATRIVEASRNSESKVLLIEGADHTFNIFTGDMTAFNQLIEATVDWFDKTL